MSKSYLLALFTAISSIAPIASYAVSPNVIITEIFPAGEERDTTAVPNDYVELYNPTSSPINLSGWSLQYSAGFAINFNKNMKFDTEGSIIPPKGFFLVDLYDSQLNPGRVHELPAPDEISGLYKLNPDSGMIALVSKTGNIGGNINDPAVVDLVGYGPGTIRYEGSGPTPRWPAGDLTKSIQRIRNYVSPTDYVVWRDHDNNATDFIIETRTRSNTQSTTVTHVPVSLSRFQVE